MQQLHSRATIAMVAVALLTGQAPLQWTTNTLSTPRFEAASASVGDKAFVAGGATGTTSTMTRCNEFAGSARRNGPAFVRDGWGVADQVLLSRCQRQQEDVFFCQE